MISTNDFQTGLTIELDGTVYSVEEYEHSKTGRGGAFVRTKLRNIEEGKVIQKTFRAGEKVNRAHVEKREMRFLYWDGNNYIFMDNQSYDQVELSKEQLGNKTDYLKENMNINVLMYKNRPIDIDLPTFIELEVKKTEPGIRGDTVSGGDKPATLETDLVIKVPLFIEEGDMVKVDTRTDEYIERV
ncbi:MAG: elongation factor P [bacterium]